MDEQEEPQRASKRVCAFYADEEDTFLDCKLSAQITDPIMPFFRLPTLLTMRAVCKEQGAQVKLEIARLSRAATLIQKNYRSWALRVRLVCVSIYITFDPHDDPHNEWDFDNHDDTESEPGWCGFQVHSSNPDHIRQRKLCNRARIVAYGKQPGKGFEISTDFNYNPNHLLFRKRTPVFWTMIQCLEILWGIYPEDINSPRMVRKTIYTPQGDFMP